jgi:hypothetical protein
MNGSHKVLARVGQVQAKVAAGVAPGMGNFVCSLVQADQDYSISGSRLTRGAVVDPTG